MPSSAHSSSYTPPLSPIPSSPPTSPPYNAFAFPHETALGKVKRLLQQLLRITVNDGRVFVGTFAGTDKPLNIVMINAEEFRIGPDQNPDGRYVGQIMLPWKIIVKVEAAPEKSRPSGMYI
ncbi:hypothetical protein BDN70DRAFT_840001 [Pholiota conissans]|uniref:Sm domain-containing protein n=1 Tax=Pholiota conissans TaxID=109636 RepID=A0A9P5YUD1_9AGAR|nr:hypothetical protein BDN70DRAFT_840001 [Pholiota conissans]